MEIRKAKRELTCRGCGRDVDKGEEIFHTYSSACNTMNIYFCEDCMENLHDMFHNWLYDRIGL